MNEYLEKDMVTPEGARKLADAFDEACKYGPANVLRDLATQVESLQADAERYRWLRDSKIDDDAQEWLCVGVFDMCGVSEIDGSELDAAIDEARKQS